MQNNYGWNRPVYNPAPHYEIIKVNGEAGAQAFCMGPNSSQFLADSTNAQRIWVAQTDGAGYATLTPLKVTPYPQETPIDLNNLEARIKTLEDTLNEYVNSGTNKQSKKQQQQQQHTNTVPTT